MSYHGIIGYHIPDFFEKLAAIWNSIQGHSDLPAIAASGSNVYVVWFDNTPGNFEIFLRALMQETYLEVLLTTAIVPETQLPQP